VIQNSIVAKLWLTIVGMVGLVLLLLSFLLQQFFDNYVYQQQGAELRRVAFSVQTLIEKNPESLSSNVRLANNIAVIFDNANIVVQVPIAHQSTLGKVFDAFNQPDKQLFMNGQPVIREAGTGGKDHLSVYLLVKSPRSGAPGMIQVTQKMSTLDAPLTRMRNLIVFAVVLGVLLTTGLAFVVSKNLSRPLVQMNKAAEDMARGNFHHRIQVVTKDEVGRLGRTFNFLTNELERTIAALSVEKDQLSSILSSLVDGVVAADAGGHITLANPPALRRLASFYDLSVAPEPPSSDGDKRLPAPLLSMMENVSRVNQTQTREMNWHGRDYVFVMTPLYESDGSTPRGVVCVFRDITEEKKLDRLRKDFIANVSHELRTPLSMMQGYSEALLDEFGDDPVSRRELTGIIHDESLRMKRLVNDLLDLAQLESGHFQMDYQQIDFAELIERVGRKFSQLAAEQIVSLETKVPAEQILILADADRMEQVCTNLVDNAIRHTHEGGHVTLVLSRTERLARLTVTDTGSGIPKDDLPYIWERFYKADKARTRGASGGIGLGLSITRHIILEHGGDIMVNSREGHGTTFTVSLPLGDLRQASQEE
jgi:two-component system, OmpR family, sensor histidine kinase ResE